MSPIPSLLYIYSPLSFICIFIYLHTSRNDYSEYNWVLIALLQGNVSFYDALLSAAHVFLCCVTSENPAELWGCEIGLPTVLFSAKALMALLSVVLMGKRVGARHWNHQK